MFYTTAGQGFLCTIAERVFADGKYLGKVGDLKDLVGLGFEVAQFQAAYLFSYPDYQAEEGGGNETDVGKIQDHSVCPDTFEQLEDFFLEDFNVTALSKKDTVKRPA